MPPLSYAWRGLKLRVLAFVIPLVFCGLIHMREHQQMVASIRQRADHSDGKESFYEEAIYCIALLVGVYKSSCLWSNNTKED